MTLRSSFFSGKKGWRTLAALSIVAGLLIPASSWADAPADGFFYGIDMEPIAGAVITTVETEPAVALVFAVDQKTADVTKAFDDWYLRTDRPQVTVYAIGVVPDGLSRDVALEAIQQRALHMPVFLANSDMLLGDDFRISVLNDDAEVSRFTTLDVDGVYAALKGEGVTIPTPVSTPAPQAVVEEPLEPAPTTANPAVADSIRGGTDGKPNLYVNDQYGMQVLFPPGWQFQVAGQGDGAVAIAPKESQLDMRIWALPADSGISTPQDYVDQRLENLAQKYKTRVNIERHLRVVRNGHSSVDVTYTFTRPLNEAAPARGGMVYRGRMMVYLEDGNVKAAGVEAPAGHFMAAFPLVNSFIRSFENTAGDISSTSRYNTSKSL